MMRRPVNTIRVFLFIRDVEEKLSHCTGVGMHFVQNISGLGNFSHLLKFVNTTSLQHVCVTGNTCLDQWTPVSRQNSHVVNDAH